jgi:hypothetical protein
MEPTDKLADKFKVPLKRQLGALGWAMLLSTVAIGFFLYVEVSNRRQSDEIIQQQEDETARRLNHIEDQLQETRNEWVDKINRKHPELKLPHFDPPPKITPEEPLK